MPPHRIFYWLDVPKEDNLMDIPDEEIAEQYGVPERVVLNYWTGELAAEAAVKTLPRALLLIVFFALMALNHESPSTVQAIEKAIEYDIFENGNFAFSTPGAMGHKNFEDANSIADFWSWMNLGFSAIYLPQSTSVSELSTLPSASLPRKGRSMYLLHNRKLGPVKLSQETVVEAGCKNPGMAKHYNLTCLEPGSMSPYLRITPTVFNVDSVEFVEDTDKTAWLNYQSSQPPQLLRELERTGWLNARTHRAKVSFMSYNGQSDVLTITDIHFMFATSGMIWKKIVMRSIILNPYVDWWTLVFEVFFFGVITWIFLEELIEVWAGMFQYKCNPIKFLRGYLGFWNTVDWISVILAYVMMGLWIAQMILGNDLQKKLEAITSCSDDFVSCAAGYSALHSEVEYLGALVRRSGIVSGFYPLCIMLRLFKAFSSQPRLAVVTRTLSRAAGDLAHFGIVFISVFFTYVFMGMTLFGRNVEGFSQLDLAVSTLFITLMGEFEVPDLEDHAGRSITFVFFGTYMCTALMLLLNMLIAIIMDVYAETKHHATSSSPVWDDAYDLVRRAKQNWQGKRLPLPRCVKVYVEKNKDAMESEKVIKAENLIADIPGLKRDQAKRALLGAVNLWKVKNPVEVLNEDILNGINHLFALRDVQSPRSPTSSAPVRRGVTEVVHTVPPATKVMEVAPEELNFAVQRDTQVETEELCSRTTLQVLIRAALLRLEKYEAPGERDTEVLQHILTSAERICATSVDMVSALKI
eukprot:gb/GFBE01001045.1/.p1 GENE.gb/GFBE01001045.1/~~gb/GFBE01001045.1/.p1  ORF type:complete len:752 (+),score=175.73 gb/GFBE01001045.1/:1-2256(+)